MDVFSLRSSLINQYETFARSFTNIRAQDLREQIDREYRSGRFWPDPLIQINPRFKFGESVRTLVDKGQLHPDCARLFNIQLYLHQQNAIALASKGSSYVVTTGTGSGKSLCFFIPIVNAILQEKVQGEEPRTRAIVIYPMNALANSQMKELEKHLGSEGPVTYGRFTGQERPEERDRIRKNPPDILLTNFMMLELLMTRQDEVNRDVIKNCTGLRFLVLDELHTYRGRQGADVAMLVRRVRERLASDRLQCIGTSATMATGGDQESRNTKVAEVASKLFATTISAFDVVTEDLDRATDPSQTNETVRGSLGGIIDSGIPDSLTNEQLAAHPLAIWMETSLGITRPDNRKWVRAKPLTLAEATRMLADESGRPPDKCNEALRRMLLLAVTPENQRPGCPGKSDDAFFVFKLHQFISGAGVAYATLEKPGNRAVRLEGQLFLPGDEGKRLYPTYFCRDCGQEYHPVRIRLEEGIQKVLARDIDDMPSRQEDAAGETADAEEDAEAERLGFLAPIDANDPLEFTGRVEEYPETWIETDRNGEPRLKRNYRKLAVEQFNVAPDGVASTTTGRPMWFLPGKFRFCLRCGTTHGAQGKDINRLAALSAEGRSSATTVIITSIVRWMHEAKSPAAAHQRKILGFTDNRQDAALQAGHFNDFTFVSLLRGAIYAAVEKAGVAGLRDTEIGDAVLSALGFDRPVSAHTNPADSHRAEWMNEPTETGHNLQSAEQTLRDVLAYRAWYDQRRGWRYTNPNLEELGMLEVRYVGLDEFSADQDTFRNEPRLLRNASPQVRFNAFMRLFDYMRKGLAVDAAALDRQMLERLREDAIRFLRLPWAFGRDEKLPGWRWLILTPPSRRNLRLSDEEILLRGGIQTRLGGITGAGRLRRICCCQAPGRVGERLRPRGGALPAYRRRGCQYLRAVCRNLLSDGQRAGACRHGCAHRDRHG